ncbi:MAG TPA: CU044_2847 family protein [Pseudonocardiaceae bacterium]|nr:CU044_2847 family protein [Pseudonocardiaceae bacterium]
MQEYVEVRTADGVLVPFAVGGGPDDFDGPVPASRSLTDARNRVAASLEDGVDLVRSVARTVAGRLDSAPRPTKITVEVGLTVSAEAAILVAKSSAEAHVTITLEWDGASTGSTES